MAPALRRLPQLGLVLGAVFAVVIGFLTLTPVPVPVPSGGLGLDKVYHLVAFAGLVFPVIATGPQRWVWAAPAAMIYGGAIELIQPYVNREAEWLDFVANNAGVVVGTWLGWVAYRHLLPWIDGARD